MALVVWCLPDGFATHLPEAGYDKRTLPELLGQTDVGTTLIYTRVLNRGGQGVRGRETGRLSRQGAGRRLKVQEAVRVTRNGEWGRECEPDGWGV